MWILVVETYEPSASYPIVEHRFRGRTQKEAMGYYESHLKADRFISSCADRGLFEGRVKCRNVNRWERDERVYPPPRTMPRGARPSGGY